MVAINVKLANGTVNTIDGLALTDTVRVFKEKIASTLSIPVEQQRLVFSGQMLQNDKSLGDCNLADGAVVHLVTSARTAAPAPDPVAAPAAPTSLFGAPSAASAAPRPGAGGGPPMSMGNLQALMQSPQGQMMVQQILSNPQILQQIMASNPELAQNPQALAMLQDPEFLAMMSNPANMAQGLQGMMAAGMQGGLSGGATPIPRALFDQAIACMNGEPVPEGLPEAGRRPRGAAAPAASATPSATSAAPASSGASSSAASAPAREFISRDLIREALQRTTTALGLPTEPQSPATSTAATMASEPQEEAAAVGMDTAESAAPTPADSGDSMDATAGSPAQRYSAQLEQLRAMGITDEAACIQALQATNGDVQAALGLLL